MIDPTDKSILALLQKDGKITFKEVASQLNFRWSPNHGLFDKKYNVARSLGKRKIQRGSSSNPFRVLADCTLRTPRHSHYDIS